VLLIDGRRLLGFGGTRGGGGVRFLDEEREGMDLIGSSLALHNALNEIRSEVDEKNSTQNSTAVTTRTLQVFNFVAGEP